MKRRGFLQGLGGATVAGLAPAVFAKNTQVDFTEKSIEDMLIAMGEQRLSGSHPKYGEPIFCGACGQPIGVPAAAHFSAKPMGEAI